MRFFGAWGQRDELDDLRTRREIDLFIEREHARQVRAERREAEAQVRHRNFELITEIVLLVFAVAIATSVIAGAMNNPGILKISILAASAWGAVAAALLRLLSSKPG